MLRTPDPILVIDLFPDERRALLSLLESLPPNDWLLPTMAGDWSVKDVAAHLVADDFGRLSRERDGYREDRASARETLGRTSTVATPSGSWRHDA